MIGLDLADAGISGEFGEYLGFPVLDSGFDGALAGGFGAVFGRATAVRWNAVRKSQGLSLGLAKAYFNDADLTIQIAGAQLPARATATSIRRAVAWALAGGGNRTLGVPVR